MMLVNFVTPSPGKIIVTVGYVFSMRPVENLLLDTRLYSKS